MTPKELEKIVLDKIYEGSSHQAIYDELNAKFPNREIDLARIVSSNVSLPQRAAYSTHNIILMVVLIVNICLGVFNAFLSAMAMGAWVLIFGLIFPAVYVVLLIGAVRWDLRTYKSAGYLGILGLFSVSTSMANGSLNFFRAIPSSLNS